jgi:NADPH:quinone reductase-like Zn-dependent oxidoreductase
MDVPGTVEAVGQNVTQFQTGDELFGICDGSFAEYAFPPQDMVARKTRGPDLRAVGGTHAAFALQALRDAGSIKSGQRVLIVESSGGVGVFALQMSFAGVARLGVPGFSQ